MTDECTVYVSKCTISATKTTNPTSSCTTATTTITTKTMSTPHERNGETEEQTENPTTTTIDAEKATTNHGQTNGKCEKNGFPVTHMDDKPDAFGCSFGGGNGLKKTIEHSVRMPVSRDATDYNMNHKNRGLAFIFNHETFAIPHLSKRSGTDKDCYDLKETLEQLHFEVSVHKDCKFKEIIEVIEKASSQDHTDNDCILIAILSHGDLGCLYASDVFYKLDTLAHYFAAHACPTLAGKPKLFFIQACRGDNIDAGIVLQQKTETDGDSSGAYKIPVHADFLYAYSTIPGFYSWRSAEDGSWFIQALVHELRANAKNYDILTLLTFVNQRVAFDKESYAPGNYILHNRKQIPCITSMLTRILRFNDKIAKE